MAKSKATTEKVASTAATEAESVLADIAQTTAAYDAASAEKSRLPQAQEKIGLDEEIPCVSLTFGGLTWRSPKTNFYFRWNDFGSVAYLPFDELVTMNNTNREFLFKPLLVVQDPRVVQYFHLLDTYSDVRMVSQLEEVFLRTPDEIARVLDTILRANMRDAAISKIRQMRRDGSLSNIDVIQMVEAKLHFDLSQDAPQGR